MKQSSCILIKIVTFPLKLVDQFAYFGCNISLTERDPNIHIGKVSTAIDKLTITWKSDLSDKIKWEFFYDIAVSLQLYGYTIQTLIKCLEKE